MRMAMAALLILTVVAVAAVEAAARPVLVPDAAVISLDGIGAFEVGYAYRGKPEKQLPLGWTGHFHQDTGVACRWQGEVAGKKALLLHCPWIGGTGVSFQQFTFKLPKVRRIELRGSTAMGADAIGKSDGATFRVYADANKLLDVNRADAEWKPFSLDLTPYAGKTVTIRFETDPGPKDNPGWDFSLWGDRELVLEGYQPKPATHPDPARLDLARMLSRRATVVPPSGFDGKTSVKVIGDKAILRYAGPDGTLEYTWKRPDSADGAFFGEITLRARMKGDSPTQTRPANGARVEWTGPVKLLDSIWVPKPDSIACVRDVEIGGEPAVVTVTGRIVGKSLVLDVACGKPVVKSFDAGSWLPALRRVPVPAPYYSGQVSYLPTENLFVNAFLDWTCSNASLHDGVRANYGALTDGSRNTLKERVVYTAAWHLAEALPSIPNAPSPYLREVGEKVTLDVWGGSFDEIARKLEALHDLGLDKCIVLIHNWQRSGYDNALPMHYPANAGLGGDEAMKKLVATARRLGYLIALHENYVDYYPNFDSFDPNDISLGSDGKPENAWFNAGTGIQAFAEKPNSILKFAGQQSSEIHRRYGTNANYLDVHSAVPPWFHVDFRACEDGAGMFSRVWDVHRELYAFERKTFGGPVFGEGNNHWYWSGLLDGVEAQFGTGWGWNQGTSAPLAVDFDLLRIHPLQCNQGMGYYERWSEKIGWGRMPPITLLDQYRMQEMAYGHSGFLGSTTWSSEPLAWLEHHLTTPVSARFAASSPTSIRYEVNGKWLDSTAAAKAGVWNRVQVRYANGLTITANDSDELMEVEGHILPRFGWLARGAGVTAYTAVVGGAGKAGQPTPMFLSDNPLAALINGRFVDYAETSDSVFANARNALDWDVLCPRRITPEASVFATAGREFRADYTWRVNSKLDKDYLCFVHFDDPSKPESERIRFQQDHAPTVPTSQWKLKSTAYDGPYTIRLPDDLPDGDYVWYIGLHLPKEARVPLSGVDDGSNRIRLGILKVRDKGKSIAFERERGSDTEREKLYRANLNNLTWPVDFGTVRTDGSVLVRREGDEWVLRTWPRGRDMLVELSIARFKMPARVTCVGGTSPTIAPKPTGSYWRLPLCGAKEYRWRAE